jgi:hypothetical protein
MNKANINIANICSMYSNIWKNPIQGLMGILRGKLVRLGVFLPQIYYVVQQWPANPLTHTAHYSNKVSHCIPHINNNHKGRKSTL